MKKTTSLPLYNKVVFTDWHGVLCHDYFWMNTLLQSRLKRHFRASLVELRRNIFNDHTNITAEWMRGNLNSNKVLTIAAETQSSEFVNFAARRLHLDCKNMRADEILLNLYREIRLNAWIVVATDNMDCFIEAFDTTQELKSHFDDILCSSELGVLKSENPILFFGKWLKAYGLSFSDALLIDDSLSNCEAFTKAGGKSILFTSFEDIAEQIREFAFNDNISDASVSRLHS